MKEVAVRKREDRIILFLGVRDLYTNMHHSDCPLLFVPGRQHETPRGKKSIREGSVTAKLG